MSENANELERLKKINPAPSAEYKRLASTKAAQAALARIVGSCNDLSGQPVRASEVDT